MACSRKSDSEKNIETVCHMQETSRNFSIANHGRSSRTQSPNSTKAQHRGGRREKRYGVLITCFQTRAIHIVLVYSQSTDDFMKAFTKFISRRSRLQQIFSDCGTKFVGTYRELHDIMNKWTNDPRLHKRLTNENIKWIFNPPAAPHMGGVCESLVKLAKRAIIATTKEAAQTDEELMTVLTECEVMLNN